MIRADHVKETTTTEGTGPIALGGVPGDHPWKRFGDVLSDGQTCRYVVGHANQPQFEVGIGRYDAENDTLERVDVFETSDGDGEPISLSQGQKIILMLDASDIAGLRADDNVTYDELVAFNRTPEEAFREKILFRAEDGTARVRWEYPPGTVIEGPRDATEGEREKLIAREKKSDRQTASQYIVTKVGEDLQQGATLYDLVTFQIAIDGLDPKVARDHGWTPPSGQ